MKKLILFNCLLVLLLSGCANHEKYPGYVTYSFTIAEGDIIADADNPYFPVYVSSGNKPLDLVFVSPSGREYYTNCKGSITTNDFQSVSSETTCQISLISPELGSWNLKQKANGSAKIKMARNIQMIMAEEAGG